MANYTPGYYTGDGVTTDRAVPWPYLDKSHVYTYVNGVFTAVTWVNASTIRFSPAPANGALITIKRITPGDVLVQHSVGPVSPEDLNYAYMQTLFRADELQFEYASAVSLSDSFSALYLGPRTADPGPGTTGQMYFNTTTGFLRVWNGTAWTNSSAAAVGLGNVNNTSDATKFTNTPLTGSPTINGDPIAKRRFLGTQTPGAVQFFQLPTLPTGAKRLVVHVAAVSGSAVASLQAFMSNDNGATNGGALTISSALPAASNAFYGTIIFENLDIGFPTVTSLIGTNPQGIVTPIHGTMTGGSQSGGPMNRVTLGLSAGVFDLGSFFPYVEF